MYSNSFLPFPPSLPSPPPLLPAPPPSLALLHMFSHASLFSRSVAASPQQPHAWVLVWFISPRQRFNVHLPAWLCGVSLRGGDGGVQGQGMLASVAAPRVDKGRAARVTAPPVLGRRGGSLPSPWHRGEGSLPPSPPQASRAGVRRGKSRHFHSNKLLPSTFPWRQSSPPRNASRAARRAAPRAPHDTLPGTAASR